MTTKSIKKYVVLGMGILAIAPVLYYFFISYITSNGFRDYVEFCGIYIPMIDKYNYENKHLPKELSTFKKRSGYPRYDEQKCMYFTNDGNYSLIVPTGLIGYYTYSSETDEWVRE